MAFKYLLPQKVQMRLYVRLGDVLDWTILPSTAEGSDGGGGGCRGVMDRSLNICKGEGVVLAGKGLIVQICECGLGRILDKLTTC